MFSPTTEVTGRKITAPLVGMGVGIAVDSIVGSYMEKQRALLREYSSKLKESKENFVWAVSAGDASEEEKYQKPKPKQKQPPQIKDPKKPDARDWEKFSSEFSKEISGKQTFSLIPSAYGSTGLALGSPSLELPILEGLGLYGFRGIPYLGYGILVGAALYEPTKIMSENLWLDEDALHILNNPYISRENKDKFIPNFFDIDENANKPTILSTPKEEPRPSVLVTPDHRDYLQKLGKLPGFSLLDPRYWKEIDRLKGFSKEELNWRDLIETFPIEEIQKPIVFKSEQGDFKQYPETIKQNDKIDAEKVIYKPANYHHSQSSGLKSKAPTDPQKALNNAYKVKDTSDRLVGVDVENQEIVIFDRTQGNIYHGHVRTFKELLTDQDIVNCLKSNKLIKSNGKIIKQEK